ncbi:multidrug efflux RND transporter permease subunit [Myxococcus sp. K15C18031901]|uniref:efflux RND transporter permease subunit n=1 Tax=Myxococcus dinghuensis TaxID=2906761 RepID=UPI0020A8302A|nr:multidrug efflux RND transporter permease subunit [Myxococcus dinghuensis]MCP3098136.1 multidrug efflux RND transporter permease subunit [Myxococcus dinghuensis]
MFVDFFIRRPVFAIVCSILLTLVGAIAIPTLPIAQYPDLAPPQVTVTSTYVGASAEVVESAVTIPLEQELNGVEGMRYISSTSDNDGVSQITITFEATRDLEAAAIDVQNRVSRAAARLPSQVNQTGIVVNKASSQILLSVALFSPDNRYDVKFLSNYADVNLKDAIKRVRGVGEVRIFGERRLSMRVWLDPTELARRKLTPQDVTRALQEQNLQVAAGQVGQPPSLADQPYQLAVRAQGRLVEPEEFGEIILMRDPSGKSVRIQDVGRVEMGAENYSTLLRFGGKQAVGIATFQLPTANALEVRDAIFAELTRLSAYFPAGMEYQTGTDTTLAVRATVHEVLRTLVEAIVLVVLVILLFLHGWRSVLITALTLPVSLVGTFAFVKLMDFSINTLTLFGLTLATGLVVDDAIVVIENIERLMTERKLSATEAARAGMQEVSGAVIAISIVLVAVFLPVAFFPGTTGAIYRQFALTIAASVALSTFCALTLTPALSARMLSEHAGEKPWFFRQVDALLDATRRVYGRWLRRLLGRPGLILLAFLLCIAATVALVRATPTGFIPDEDQGYIIVSVQGPEGTSLAQTEQVMAEVERLLAAQPEVRAIFANGGFSTQGTGPNMANIFVLLKHWDERPGKDQSVAALVERLRGPLNRIGGARIIPFQPPAIRGVGAVGGFQYVLQDAAGTSSLDELTTAAQQLMAVGNDDARLRGVFTGFNANTPLLEVDVDRQKAKALGVSLDQVFGTLQVYLGSQYVNDFNYANRAYRVYVQADQPFRDSPSDISAFYVRGEGGDMLPLESLVTVRPTVSAQVIRHYNLFRSVDLSGQPAPGVSSGQAMEAMEALAARHLPQGMSAEWSGISLEQKQSGGQTLLIFALGLLFVFLVLAAQYESFILPLVIILSVPLALMGALGLQLWRGFANDVFCQLGLVMLVGLASKNAILIVEFAEQLREQGRSAVDAVVEAAEVRLRPILMTSIAFLLGVVPMMTAQGAGSASRNSLGTAVFGGMLVSTVVNFVFIPGLYVLTQKLRAPPKAVARDARALATPSP